jgi:hypothetical protein
MSWKIPTSFTPDVQFLYNFTSVSCNSTGQYIITGLKSQTNNYISSNYGISFSPVNSPLGGGSNSSAYSGMASAISYSGQYSIIGLNNKSYQTNKALISTNYGATFNIYFPNGGQFYNAPYTVACADNGIFVASCLDNYIYTSTDSGNTWNKSTNPFTNAACIATDSTGTLWFAAVNNTSSIYICTDSIQSGTNFGTSWELIGKTVTSGINLLTVKNNGAAILVGNTAGSYLLSNPTARVATWKDPTNVTKTQLGTNYQYLNGSEDLTTIIGGGTSQLGYSTNLGTSFSTITSPSPSNITINSTGTQWVIANTDVNGIYVSSNKGTSWIQTKIMGPTNSWSAIVTSATGQYVYAFSDFANSNSPAYYSPNYGNDWYACSIYTSSGSSISTSFQSAACSYDGRCIYITSSQQKQVFYSSNYGVTFTASTISVTGNGFNTSNVCIATSYYGDVVIAVDNDAVYVSTNYGVTFTSRLSAGTGETFLSVGCSQRPGTFTAFVSSSSTMYRSTNSGQNWISLPAGFTNSQRIVGASDNSTFYASSGYKTTDAGVSWFQLQHGGNPLVCSIDGSILATTDGSNLDISLDYGNSWITKPNYDSIGPNAIAVSYKQNAYYRIWVGGAYGIIREYIFIYNYISGNGAISGNGIISC